MRTHMYTVLVNKFKPNFQGGFYIGIYSLLNSLCVFDFTYNSPHNISLCLLNFLLDFFFNHDTSNDFRLKFLKGYFVSHITNTELK